MSRKVKIAVAALAILSWQASSGVEADSQQSVRVDIASLGASGDAAAAELLGEVYEQRGFAPVWQEPARVESLLEAIRASDADGLLPADYDVTGITQEQVARDVTLTHSLVRLVYHLYYGKVDQETRAVTGNLGRPLNGRPPSTVINEIVTADDLRSAIAAVVPRDAGYERLQVQLQRYRRIAAAGGWPVVASGPTIRPGSNDPRLATLAKRLAISGDLVDDNGAAVAENYGQALQDAVRRFQARHGLQVDALVGRATLRALNVPVDRRIDQIRVNLERARWRLSDDTENLILVNVAAFRAYVILQRKTVWTTKVIIGTTENKTPLFQAALKQIVFNPTWTVPRSILIKEMLPKIKADPGFLTRGNYRLFDSDGNVVDSSAVDWRTIHAANFPFTVVQQPGPVNQLGQIKFMIPNEYSVCMHDTPDRYLFTRAGRAFSHGCIRVDKPIDLAEVLLAGEGWTRRQIDARIASKQTSTAALTEPLPVVVLYWTAEVNEQGELQFYDDIYERDATVLASLDRPLAAPPPR